VTTRHRTRRAAEGDRGAAAVEFALVLPLLLLLVFGIVDFGRALNAQIMVSQAAREGARWNALGASPTEIAQRVSAAGQPLSLSPTSAVYCGTNPASQVGSVTISYTFHYVTPIGALMHLAGMRTMTITSTGVMRCQG
jgi:Flp pilus assembly protein TadG